ncbi:MauE/DoxX family redox-associated membrane protein [Actinospica robiniae]|uniref:MauE/DoxX family redox-associated membrane protein n=1 Tax=Actinospica robiniae TaxID=304901 RepID=UPI00041B1588|nr:MauE/DoxX family redox-associated membrane protein [Actinospica robiniae]
MPAFPLHPTTFRRLQPLLSLPARAGLCAMWLYYAVPKLSYSNDALGLAVRAYRIAPDGLADAFGTVQPFLELALGLLVLIGLGTRLAAALSALLLLVYIAGIISLGARGIAINCGCGGIASQAAAGHTRYILDVLRDVGYLVPAGWLIWQPRSPLVLDSWLLGEPEPRYL